MFVYIQMTNYIHIGNLQRFFKNRWCICISKSKWIIWEIIYSCFRYITLNTTYTNIPSEVCLCLTLNINNCPHCDFNSWRCCWTWRNTNTWIYTCIISNVHIIEYIIRIINVNIWYGNSTAKFILECCSIEIVTIEIFCRWMFNIFF